MRPDTTESGCDADRKSDLRYFRDTGDAGIDTLLPEPGRPSARPRGPGLLPDQWEYHHKVSWLIVLKAAFSAESSRAGEAGGRQRLNKYFRDEAGGGNGCAAGRNQRGAGRRGSDGQRSGNGLRTEILVDRLTLR